MCQKNFFGRGVEGSCLSKAGPKRGCFSYLITISVILHKSDVSFVIIAIRYDDHPLFGPAVDKNKPSELRDQKSFFFAQKSGDLFFSIKCKNSIIESCALAQICFVSSLKLHLILQPCQK